ncbi:hypothetical protein PIB30_044212 [Stylosanthes scabra]|uniref:Uncharacterized protein n=1 Tax=Stylosanthes scabra TaxID=79078 RepID=A0ABU6TFF2_9FABA|nr:hypothetical protein [Stylosanthes scabra]
MCRNREIADLKATSSKSLIDKLRSFEMNRQKIVKARENYGMQEMSSPNKEADLARLGDAQDKGKEDDLATKRKKKHYVSRLAVVDCGRQMTATQCNVKEREVANRGMNKHMTRFVAVEDQRELTTIKSKQKEVDVATQGVNKSVPRLDDVDNQRGLTATQIKLKEVEVATKNMKKPIPKKLDFTHLQGTFDRISNKINTMPAGLGEQRSTHTQ